jgi:predicted alpha/beta-hydrolase family hydrolase
VKIDTDSGLASLTWHGGIPSQSETAGRPTGILLLGHGAGGGIAAPDLLVVARLARARAIAVGLVEQPYRVAGKRAPVPAPRLDVAFTAVAQAARIQVQAAGLREPVLLVGGRSSGARVACRTAVAAGALGVLALAFPLSPPRAPGRERPSRLPELLDAGVPVLVVQGERDVFGSADQLRRELDAPKACGAVCEEVIVSTAVGADHALRKGIDASVVAEWLTGFLT